MSSAQAKLTSRCPSFPGLPSLPDPGPALFLEFRDSWLLNRWSLPIALQPSHRPASPHLPFICHHSSHPVLPMPTSWAKAQVSPSAPFLSHRAGNPQLDLTVRMKNSVSSRTMLNLDGLVHKYSPGQLTLPT